MTQVEHQAAALAVARENGFDLSADPFRRSIQYGRVHVALQRHALPHARAGIAQVGGPVDAERISARIRHGFEPLAAVLGEQDHRHAPAFVLAREALDNPPHVAQREFTVIPRCQHTSPGVEQHQRLRAGGDLCIKVGRHRARQHVK